MSYWMRPGRAAVGLLTTISPRRISFFILRTPPPMPTIKLSRMDLKLARIGMGMATAKVLIHAEGRVCEYYVMIVETS